MMWCPVPCRLPYRSQVKPSNVGHPARGLEKAVSNRECILLSRRASAFSSPYIQVGENQFMHADDTKLSGELTCLRDRMTSRGTWRSGPP